MKNGNGDTMFVIITCSAVNAYLIGGQVQARSTIPASGGHHSAIKDLTEDAVLFGINPDRVTVGECIDGVFTIQKKGVKTKTAKTVAKKLSAEKLAIQRRRQMDSLGLT